MKVSVIIPVYNCEKYLEDCIKSLVNQTLNECEFIFVNDGSKDNSLNILKSYEKKDKRIKVISQENQGVSAARNTGLKASTGSYVGFVDADDSIDKDYYYKLYKTAIENDVEIVFCNWKSESCGKINKLNLPFKKNNILDKQYIEGIIYPFFIEHDSFNSVCNKVFKTSLLNENNIKFPLGIELGEDALFNVRAFTYATKAFYIEYSGYFYREVEGSATRNVINKDYFKRALSVYNAEIKEYSLWKLSKVEIKKLKAIKFINNILGLTYIYFTPNKNNSFLDRYKYVKNMITTKEVSQIFKNNKEDIYLNKGRYEKAVLKFIENKFTMGIYLATRYSRYRNNS